MKPAYQFERLGMKSNLPGILCLDSQKTCQPGPVPEQQTQHLVGGESQQLNLLIEDGALLGDSAGQRLIPLTKGYSAIVDECDYESLSRYKWQVCTRKGYTPYARRVEPHKGYSMHRQVLGLEHGDRRFVDHINGNGLDNRRCNLRVCTNQQNQANRAPSKGMAFKGVQARKDCARYRAYIKVNGAVKHLGSFLDPISAAKAYDEAALRYFGEFARLNFPEAQP